MDKVREAVLGSISGWYSCIFIRKRYSNAREILSAKIKGLQEYVVIQGNKESFLLPLLELSNDFCLLSEA